MRDGDQRSQCGAGHERGCDAREDGPAKHEEESCAMRTLEDNHERTVNAWYASPPILHCMVSPPLRVPLSCVKCIFTMAVNLPHPRNVAPSTGQTGRRASALAQMLAFALFTALGQAQTLQARVCCAYQVPQTCGGHRVRERGGLPPEPHAHRLCPRLHERTPFGAEPVVKADTSWVQQ